MRSRTQTFLPAIVSGCRKRASQRGRIAMLAVLTALAACGRGAEAPAVSAASANSANAALFTVPAEQMSHVQIYTVTPGNLQRVLRLTGTVAYDTFHTTPVITAIGGPVARIVAAPGTRVKRGDPMLYVSSPDYAQLRATYLKALSASQVADKEYTRSQTLYARGAIAERDLLAAQGVRDQAQADLQNALQGLRILGIDKPESTAESTPTAELPVRAPIDGEVVEQLVGPGQLLQAGTTQCFTISDLSAVWVLVNVYEHDLGYVHAGDPATIRSDAYDQAFAGTISYLAAALDPATRTLPARIVTQNPGEKLKKDMYVTATIHAGTIPNAIVVPDSAVLRDAQNEPFVYVAAGTNQFARRGITVGQSAGGQTQVAGGLKAGDQVVAQGAVFLQFANSLQQ